MQKDPLVALETLEAIIQKSIDTTRRKITVEGMLPTLKKMKFVKSSNDSVFYAHLTINIDESKPAPAMCYRIGITGAGAIFIYRTNRHVPNTCNEGEQIFNGSHPEIKEIYEKYEQRYQKRNKSDFTQAEIPPAIRG